MKPYPAKRYHATEAPRYVQTADDEAALGPGWFDSEKKIFAAAAPPVADAADTSDAAAPRRGRSRKAVE